MLNHGHIPTLVTLVVSERWFGLSLWLDVIVGYVSLLGLVWIFRTHIGTTLIPHGPVVLLALTAMLFTAAPPPHWSLLQFRTLRQQQSLAALGCIGRDVVFGSPYSRWLLSGELSSSLPSFTSASLRSRSVWTPTEWRRGPPNE